MNNSELKLFTRSLDIADDGRNPAELLVYATGLVYARAEKIINKFLTSCGTTGAQFNILVALLHCRGRGLNQIEISRKMLVSQGNITRILDNLYKNKYITRREDPQDRRHKLINITPKGRALYFAVMPRYKKLIAVLASSLNEKTKKTTAFNMLYWLKELERYEYENQK